ncbi:tetratricopeptide repeat protein [Flagellimonas meridianipacifica]|uniref:Tetratricopeptide repeat protein n=1 Tax=Flagellimonas meridianipacifica TaxID=1080225 RepID=A0A2T0MBA8_9FLAO|nr:tetratricopeptide repeat protein [Allomuricauda pacifica]PRX54794.1 tetratricopeptide repeat protein [Allomuricauda pacifica]
MIRKYLVLAITYSISTLSFSQNNKLLDSLLKVQDTISEGVPKIKNLEELYYAEIYNTPKKAKQYAFMAYELSSVLEKEESKGVALYHIGTYYKVTADNDSALYWYNKSLSVWNKLKNPRRKATTLAAIALIEQLKSNYETAIQLYDSVIVINREIKHYLNLANTIRTRATIFIDKGNYKIALEETLKGMRIFDTIQEEPWQDADTKKQLGYIEFLRGNHTNSIEHYQTALDMYIELGDKIWQCRTYCDMGKSYMSLNELDRAKECFLKSLEISKELDVLDMEVNSLLQLGVLSKVEGDYEKAQKLLMESLDKNFQFGSKLTESTIRNEIGNNLTYIEDFDSSIYQLNKAMQISDSLGALEQKRNAYMHRSFTYESLGNHAKALEDIKNFQKLNDSIFNKTKSQQIEELKTIYETEKKESALALQEEEIKTLNEKARADKLQKGLYAGGMTSALALFGLSVFGYRQRIKRNRIAREKQEEIYKQEIAHKQKELASQTLHLVQKNTFIQELKENLENLKNSPDKFKAEFRRIVMLLKKENASDKDWEVFKSYFAEVHNDFDQKLKTLYADISEKEIRLAAFLRMNLTTKEIAATLNVLPDSILKSKYRLKKKLGLDRETNLTSFLNTL